MNDTSSTESVRSWLSKFASALERGDAATAAEDSATAVDENVKLFLRGS